MTAGDLRDTIYAMATADDTSGVDNADNAGWIPVHFDKWTADGVTSGEDPLVVEAPIEYQIDGEPLATVMRTPGNDFDLAVGFLFGEGWIDSHSDIGTVCLGNRAVDSPDGPENAFTNVVDLRPSGAARKRLSIQRRHGPIVTSCGVCGKTTIEEILKTVPRPSAEWLEATRQLRLASRIVLRLPNRLQSFQPLFQRTGALHAAGIFDLSGNPLAVFEDIGRHNAVDKVVGSLLREDLVPLSKQILVVSGRLSFEIVQKALRAGLPFVVAVSGASHLAVELATEGGITLCGFTRETSFTVYSHPERIGG